IGHGRLGIVRGRLAHAEAAAPGPRLRARREGETFGEPAEVVRGGRHRHLDRVVHRGACPALVRSSISRHSPIARITRTATIAMPIAAVTAPTSNPTPLASPQSPSHWRSISKYPINPPASPLTRIATKAAIRT